MYMKKRDLILWGATSFVGKLIAQHLVTHNTTLNWAIGGRDQVKLAALKQELSYINSDALDLAVFIGNSQDIAFLNNMVQTAHVIISTVGPYLKYGENIVQVCVENGTDYCDLTGEVPFIRKMQDLYADKAKASGSRIIHCCGFDSIPSDLGVNYLNEQAKKKFDSPIIAADCIVTKMKGGASGGTIASVINMIEEIKKDNRIKKILVNPYSLCKPEHRSGIKQENLNHYKYNKTLKKWLTPFLMASVNSKIVHASNNLLDYPYSKDFQYTEYLLAKNHRRAVITYFFLNTGMLLLSITPIRKLLEKYFLPKPGEGLSAQAQKEGYFEFVIYGKTRNNHHLKVKVTGDRDPGYGSTAKMIVAAAECLLINKDKNKLPGGFWTPASALSNHLISKLEDSAGVTFRVMN